MMPTLDLRNVSKHYGNVVALDNVSLHIAEKEYVCIIGPSGCGKSTLIKCVAGIIAPDSGEILIDGQSVNQVPIEDRSIGYVFQDIALFPHMTVRENLTYGPVVRNFEQERITTITSEILDLIEMRERARSLPAELSGGAQQKVAVGRAIATGSHLFLLDEPLGALDALVRAELRYELRRLASDLGLTVIHVTHDQEEALSIADRLVIMKRGSVIEVGKPSDIYLSPKALFTENFVGEANLLRGTIVGIERDFCIVKVGSRSIRVPNSGKSVSQNVLVSVRPELIQILRASTSEPRGWRGVIREATFLGSMNRYVVDVGEGVSLIAHVPTLEETEEFQVGESVDVPIQKVRHMLLFDYPTEGLEKAIALE